MTSDLSDVLSYAYFSSVYAALAGSLSVGAYVGFHAGAGVPVAHELLSCAAIPAAATVLYGTPLFWESGNETDMCKRWLFCVGAVGSAALTPLGYGLGYVAGRLTS